MTQELAYKLIAHYERVIKEAEEAGDRYFGILRSNKVELGICMCAILMFDTDLFEDVWINSFKGGYWFDKPERDNPKSENIHLLQLRLDRLKTFKEPK